MLEWWQLFSREILRWGGNCPGVIFLGGNCPGGNYSESNHPVGNFARGQLSQNRSKLFLNFHSNDSIFFSRSQIFLSFFSRFFSNLPNFADSNFSVSYCLHHFKFYHWDLSFYFQGKYSYFNNNNTMMIAK